MCTLIIMRLGDASLDISESLVRIQLVAVCRAIDIAWTLTVGILVGPPFGSKKVISSVPATRSHDDGGSECNHHTAMVSTEDHTSTTWRTSGSAGIQRRAHPWVQQTLDITFLLPSGGPPICRQSGPKQYRWPCIRRRAGCVPTTQTYEGLHLRAS